MEKLSSTLRNMLLSLTGICIIVSGILALVNKVTKAPIEEAQVKAKVEAISAVTPKFDNNPFAEKIRVLPEGETDSLTVYPAKMKGQLVGFAIESYTQRGFSGLISVMVGFDVLQHAESPGLGSLIPEWFHEKSETGGIRDMRGLDMKASAPLSVSKDGGKVDAITAATISSRAFLDAVNRAWSVFKYVQDPEGSKASGNKSSDSVSSATVSTAESANSETKS
ncbi:RnfABCDGE type electron transport complex subunit G [Porphyromonas catoniae]|uniref:RnfABCDGE type electron transport complex subunit G n=1 Tax=Porphyromonas catoniae TaxID=41976 RepID=UPI0028D46EF2|nr:RnfABCDGE type electron transport complex subunit G [Porphyromonas catoniae]